MPSLPLELLIDCYRLLFPPFYFSSGAIIEKPPWNDIAGLTLASKDNRNLILSLWFHVLKIDDLEDWKIVLRDWKRLYHWTRVIHYSSTVYKTPKCTIEDFKRLITLRIDLPTTHTTFDGETDFAAPEIAQILHHGISGDTIQHLELNGVTWLEPYVMMHVAESLPNIRTLAMKQLLVWCGLCNTVGMPSFKNNPRGIIYDGGEGLPEGYSRFLAPLKFLHTVRISVAYGTGLVEYNDLFLAPHHETDINTHSRVDFISPGNIGSEYVVCSLSTHDATISTSLNTSSPSSSGITRSTSTEKKLAGWSGECESCLFQLLYDPVLRGTWITRREAVAMRISSQDITMERKHPPCLRRVEWGLLAVSPENWPGLLP